MVRPVGPTGPGSATAQPAPVPAATVATLELLAPRPLPDDSVVRTHEAVLHLLGRSSPEAQVRVGGEPAAVFASGVFVRDHVPLQPGPNRIVVEARWPDGSVITEALLVERGPPPPTPEWPSRRDWLDGGSLQPAERLVVAPGEPVEVAVRATPGRLVQARLPGQANWQPLVEHAPGRYRAALVFDSAGDVEPAPVRLRLLPPQRGPAARRRPVQALAPGAVGQWRNEPGRLVRVLEAGVELRHGLHAVRLGGPYLGELPAGTLLNVTGQRGEFLRVQLAPGIQAWAPADAVAPAPAGTPAPRAAFSNVAIRPDPAQPGHDIVSLPLPEPVPWQLRLETDAGGQHSLVLDLYGAHHAATWISHGSGLQVVQELTVEQAASGVVRLRARLQGGRLWGWQAGREAGQLRLRLVAPPRPAASPGPTPDSTAPGSPLAGLRIALEAGHGGPTNLGAVGATRTPEKDFNRWTTDLLAEELRAAGASVIDLREGDSNPSLRERSQRAQAEGAQLYVSVHANAAAPARGYLRVSGVSTYYKYGNAQPLAAAVQQRLLEATGLPDFGLVGNFNYAPLRWTTSMPALLVEQAFVSHPGDEARLLDPAFRATLARAIRQGLEDALR